MTENGLTRRPPSLGLPLSVGLFHLATDAVAADTGDADEARFPVKPKVAMLVYNLLDQAKAAANAGIRSSRWPTSERSRA
ncbi:MAG TPA: hypothetical protein VMM15_23290 [Bradyrhizobium sp.]|nr:hypothetical protein [Bradyrhizobium sp.]